MSKYCAKPSDILNFSAADQLRIALAQDNARAVAALLRGKADPNGFDSYGDQPLGVLPRSPECIKLLLSAGANPDAQRADGRSALVAAWEMGHPLMALLLLAAGAQHKISIDGNIISAWNMRTDDGLTLFLHACRIGESQAVKAGLKAGRSPEELSAGGSSPLMCAAMEGRTHVIDILLSAGAKINATRHDGVGAAIVAAIQGHADCLDCLVKAGSDLSLTDMAGRTVIDIVSESGRHDMAAVIESAAINAALGPAAPPSAAPRAAFRL